MNSPFISICIPAYKAAGFIGETLESVRKQTFTDWELIVTEDGGDDGTHAIVHAFARSVPQRIIYNRHDTNQGLPVTRNTGIAATSGAWIAFLDSDDLWKPTHLECLVQSIATSPQYDLAFAGTQRFDHATRENLARHEASTEQLRDLPNALFMGTLSILPSSAMIRRSKLVRIGGVSTDFPHVNDTELWLRVLKAGCQATYSGVTTCLYRQHPGSHSRRGVEQIVDSARLCDRYRDWPAINKTTRHSRPAHLYRIAARINLRTNPADSSLWLWRAIQLQPFNPKTLLVACAAILFRLAPRLRTALPSTLPL